MAGTFLIEDSRTNTDASYTRRRREIKASGCGIRLASTAPQIVDPTSWPHCGPTKM
jgi:hypothetical protein